MVLEQRKTILKVLLSCVLSPKKKIYGIRIGKYRNGIFTEMANSTPLDAVTFCTHVWAKKPDVAFFSWWYGSTSTQPRRRADEFLRSTLAFLVVIYTGFQSDKRLLT